MGVDFGSLIIELETLSESSKEDFVNEFWSSYDGYVKTYNKLLADLQSLGFFTAMKPLQSVPFSEQSFDSGYTTAEKAKLREVCNSSQILLRKVKLLLSPPSKTKFSNKVRSNKIFVVHGADQRLKDEVTQTLQKLELDPVVLGEQSEIKQALIEKNGDCANISFAVVILTPDELAYSQEQTADQAKPQPNQNTVFELGYLLGRLGPENVVVVYKKSKDFQVPDLYDGVLWVEHKTGWYLELVKQLQACNYDVDANKLGWL